MGDNVDTYFAKGCGRCERFGTPDCSVQIWQEGMLKLRKICLAAGLEETLKWGHAAYRHAGRNIVILGAFRDNFRLTFMDAELLTDKDGLLEKAGPNSSTANLIKFSDAAQVKSLQKKIEAFLEVAKTQAAEGKRPKRKPASFTLPDELVAALADDSALAKAFNKLTPGRQRSYVLNLESAKQVSTRLARIEKFRPKIMASKGATER